MATDERHYAILDADLTNLNARQWGPEDTADSDLSYKMWGGKDGDGTLTRWLAKDQHGKLNDLYLTDTSHSGTSLARMIHYGDTDTYVEYQGDRIKLVAGNQTMMDLIEGATDYINMGANIVMLSNELQAGGGHNLMMQLGGNGGLTDLSVQDSSGSEIYKMDDKGNVHFTNAAPGSSWDTNYNWIEIFDRTSFSRDENVLEDIFLTHNAYKSSGNWKLVGNGQATQLEMDHDDFFFKATATGSVSGDDVTWDTIMHIEGANAGSLPQVCVGDTAAANAGCLQVRQTNSDTSGAVSRYPALMLEQDDTSEAFIEYRGSTTNGDINESLVANSDVGSTTLVGWARVYVLDGGSEITSGHYYQPIYTIDT